MALAFGLIQPFRLALALTSGLVQFGVVDSMGCQRLGPINLLDLLVDQLWKEYEQNAYLSIPGYISNPTGCNSTYNRPSTLLD
jgi:hypothetical protein